MRQLQGELRHKAHTKGKSTHEVSARKGEGGAKSNVSSRGGQGLNCEGYGNGNTC